MSGPKRTPTRWHDSMLADVGPYAAMVPEGSLGDAQRLLLLGESGLLEP